jgi:hypothetical protein
MRILFSFTIAFLFTILAACVSSAQMIDHSCHKDKQARGAMNMAQCSCSHIKPIVHADLGIGAPEGADCCLSDACSGSFNFKAVAFKSTVSSSGFSGIVQDPFFFQPIPLAMLGAHRTGLPPPRLRSTPAYIQNCSFLI